MKKMVLDWSVRNGEGEVIQRGRELAPAAAYYEQVKQRVVFRMPDKLPSPRRNLILKLELGLGSGGISENEYPIVVVKRDWFRLKLNPTVAFIGVNPGLENYLESTGVMIHVVSHLEEAKDELVVVSDQAKIEQLGGKAGLERFVFNGGKVLLLNHTAELAQSLPLAIWKVTERFGTSTFFSGTWDAPAHWGGECAFISPGHPLADGLVCPDDLRWWNSGATGPSVCAWAFNMPPSGDKTLISLCDYLAPHGYLESPQDLEKYKGSLAFEWRTGRGRLLASTLRLADDPLSRRGCRKPYLVLVESIKGLP